MVAAQGTAVNPGNVNDFVDKSNPTIQESAKKSAGASDNIVNYYNDIYTLKVNGWERTATPTYLYAESGDQAFSKELIKQEGLHQAILKLTEIPEDSELVSMIESKATGF